MPLDLLADPIVLRKIMRLCATPLERETVVSALAQLARSRRNTLELAAMACAEFVHSSVTGSPTCVDDGMRAIGALEAAGYGLPMPAPS